ncbi:MAG: ATP-binding cassette domain-containing protein [Planctomycetes bacterium]|nr:ATP-binding cassette domain-containing protein [Planctomycetota bacterium]
MTAASTHDPARVPAGAGAAAVAHGEPLLELENLRVQFPVYGGFLLLKTGEVKAVDGVSFTLAAGETLGLVGESGCGKTTLGKAIVNILHVTAPSVQVSGRILFHRGAGKDAVDLATLSPKRMRPFRSNIQMIFQDPYASLNPRFTVGRIVEEPLAIHTPMTRAERQERVAWLLEKVGLGREQATRYPHEFSGGQRQRIGIARALATSPRLIVADEPVSALDVSIQAQVINLLQDLQEEFGLSYLFVAHDLSVVKHISNRIAVMYLGSLVELGPADEVYYRPLHPYTRALLSAVPLPNPERDRANRIFLTGDVPSPMAKPSGCGFRTRCPIAKPSCADAPPPLAGKGGGRFVACPWV